MGGKMPRSGDYPFVLPGLQLRGFSSPHPDRTEDLSGFGQGLFRRRQENGHGGDLRNGPFLRCACRGDGKRT